MAWVHRTTRDQGTGSFLVQTAASHIGPGAYEASPKKKVKPNVAAFGSSAEPERGAPGTGDPGTIGHCLVTPGPGSYATSNQEGWESPSKHASSVFQSRTQREIGSDKAAKTTPGPGAYAKQDSFGKKGKVKKNVTSLGNVIRQSTPHGTKIKWARLPSAPSIPTPAQSFGYEQGPYGKLIRHEPANVGHSGRGEDTIGPGEYEPMRGLKSINKPRATDFSKSRVTRSLEQDIKQRIGMPGPGQYDDHAGSATKEAQRASAIFKSAITRDKAAPGATDTSKNVVPGPGSYFEGYKGFSQASKPDHLQFFGSTSARFDSASHLDTAPSPGPGAYYSPPQFTAKTQPLRRKGKSAPFSANKERFDHNTPKEEYSAAPGSYNLPTALADALNKVSSRVQTFGSTTKRFDSITSPQYDNAGVSSHESQLEREMRDVQINRESQGSGKQDKSKVKPSPMFASSSTRFRPLEKSAAPSPGDYEIHASWNAPGATGTFKSSTDRLKSKAAQMTDVPGPGAYSTPVAINHKPLHMARPDVFFGAEPRFKKVLPKVQVPGPGTYSSQTIENDWNRPTYNITIATEMELAMLR